MREATPADLADVVELLSARDGTRRDPSVVNAYLWGLDPDCTRIWLAYVDQQPVAITMLYLRALQWPAAAPESNRLRAGYWAHLYVEPDVRTRMIYPQLVFAMLRGMKDAGVSVIYTATRQADVAAGHQKLGFKLVGNLTLWLRPLRPLRLLAKHKGPSAIARLCGPGDAVYDVLAGRREKRSSDISNIPLDSPRLEEILALRRPSDDSRVAQLMNAEEFRRRFATTLDGTDYRITALQCGGRIVAAVVMVLAERGKQIRAGVILELIAAPDARTSHIDALLVDAERHAYRKGAEIMLMLGSTATLAQSYGSRVKYRISRSERYRLLVYPGAMAGDSDQAARLENWNFDFGDHDAF